MAHFAELDAANFVTQIVVVNNDTVENLSFPESEPIGIDFLNNLFGEVRNWKQASYNGNFRAKWPGIGYKYDPELDEFVPPETV